MLFLAPNGPFNFPRIKPFFFYGRTTNGFLSRHETYAFKEMLREVPTTSVPSWTTVQAERGVPVILSLLWELTKSASAMGLHLHMVPSPNTTKGAPLCTTCAKNNNSREQPYASGSTNVCLDSTLLATVTASVGTSRWLSVFGDDRGEVASTARLSPKQELGASPLSSVQEPSAKAQHATQPRATITPPLMPTSQTNRNPGNRVAC